MNLYTRHDARVVEQTYMLLYHSINTSNKMNNQINSIAPRFWSDFTAIAAGVLEYTWNSISDEMLYWIGS